MRSHVGGPFAWVAAGVLCLVGTHTEAAPIDYVLFQTTTLTELGTFTVDPDLAAPVGISDVDMTALSFTATVDPFGPLTVTLADLDPGSFRARFLDGQLASVTGLDSGTLPGPLGFFLDFTDFIPADPSLIDLDAVGTFAFDVGTLPGHPMHPTIGDSATGSLGIRAAVATVPEPSTLLLLGVAAALLPLRRRCWQAKS